MRGRCPRRAAYTPRGRSVRTGRRARRLGRGATRPAGPRGPAGRPHRHGPPRRRPRRRTPRRRRPPRARTKAVAGERTPRRAHAHRPGLEHGGPAAAQDPAPRRRAGRPPGAQRVQPPPRRRRAGTSRTGRREAGRPGARHRSSRRAQGGTGRQTAKQTPGAGAPAPRTTRAAEARRAAPRLRRRRSWRWSVRRHRGPAGPDPAHRRRAYAAEGLKDRLQHDRPAGAPRRDPRPLRHDARPAAPRRATSSPTPMVIKDPADDGRPALRRARRYGVLRSDLLPKLTPHNRRRRQDRGAVRVPGPRIDIGTGDRVSALAAAGIGVVPRREPRTCPATTWPPT